MSRPTSERLHALDALRAAMMLFGILMHAGLSYDGVPPTPLWGISDTQATPLADWLQAASGAFRMQTFFVVAGFFAALLYGRSGAWGLLRNRAARIAGPFIAFWFVTFTLLRLAFVAFAGGDDWPSAFAQAVGRGTLWAHPYPIHLWFLEYLLIYYLVAVLVADVVARSLAGAASIPSAALRRGICAGWTPACLALALFPALLIAPHASFGIPLSFRPNASSLASFGVCFWFGWLLYTQRDLLPVLARGGPAWLGAGVAVAFGANALDTGSDRLSRQPLVAEIAAPTRATSSFVEQEAALGLDGHSAAKSNGTVASHGLLCPGTAPAHVAHAGANAAATALIVTGLLGTFLRVLNRHSPWVRYSSDASYWLYIGHFPVVAWVSVLLCGVRLSGAAKLAITAVLSTALLLLIYEACVRTTWLGRWINGKIGAPPPWQASEAT